MFSAVNGPRLVLDRLYKAGISNHLIKMSSMAKLADFEMPQFSKNFFFRQVKL